MDLAWAFYGIFSDEDGEATANVIVLILAVICTIISWVVTCICINQHVTHWNSPPHQKIVVQMLCLVLVWSLFATLVVIRPQIVLVTKFCMDTYEAYIVALFMNLMRVYLGGTEKLPSVIQKMPKFFMCCRMVKPSMGVYSGIRVIIYQFAIIKPFFSLVQCILYYMPQLDLNLDLIFTCFGVINLISLFVAMMGLLFFYKMFALALAPYKVAAKFMALKLFVFLHLAQGIIMSQFSTPENHYQVYQLEYFLLCFEMTIAAFINKDIVFTYREFLTEQTIVKPWAEYFRMDETRLTEWKNVLSSPHLVRQDSYLPENMQHTHHHHNPHALNNKNPNKDGTKNHAKHPQHRIPGSTTMQNPYLQNSGSNKDYLHQSNYSSMINNYF